MTWGVDARACSRMGFVANYTLACGLGWQALPWMAKKDRGGGAAMESSIIAMEGWELCTVIVWGSGMYTSMTLPLDSLSI